MPDAVRPDDIEALISLFDEFGCAELHIRFENFELHLATDPLTTSAPAGVTIAAPSPAPAPTSLPAADAPAVGGEDFTGFEVVHAPYQAAFYRSPKPGEPPFVEVGDAVEAASDLCLLEVMKLFTAMHAGTAGTVARILVADGAMVAADQPLFLIQARG